MLGLSAFERPKSFVPSQSEMENQTQEDRMFRPTAFGGAIVLIAFVFMALKVGGRLFQGSSLELAIVLIILLPFMFGWLVKHLLYRELTPQERLEERQRERQRWIGQQKLIARYRARIRPQVRPRR